jgi:hypothetical protein
MNQPDNDDDVVARAKETICPQRAGITVIDPVTGEQIELEYQRMRLHPCEIISENPMQYANDIVAVDVARLFKGYQNRNEKLSRPSTRANATRIDATDLFDPELLSIHIPPEMKT